MRRWILLLIGTGYRPAVARGLATSLTSNVLGFACGLWTVAFCLRFLGGTYGLWLAGYALVSMFGLLEFSLGPSLVREVAGYRAGSASRDDWSKLFSSYFLVYCVVAVTIASLGWLCAPYLLKVIGRNANSSPDLLLALRLGALQVALAQPLGIWRSFVHGSQRLGTLGTLLAIEPITVAIFATILLGVWSSIIVLPLSLLLSTFVLATVSYVCTPNDLKQCTVENRES